MLLSTQADDGEFTWLLKLWELFDAVMWLLLLGECEWYNWDPEDDEYPPETVDAVVVVGDELVLADVAVDFSWLKFIPKFVELRDDGLCLGCGMAELKFDKGDVLRCCAIDDDVPAVDGLESRRWCDSNFGDKLPEDWWWWWWWGWWWWYPLVRFCWDINCDLDCVCCCCWEWWGEQIDSDCKWAAENNCGWSAANNCCTPCENKFGFKKLDCCCNGDDICDCGTNGELLKGSAPLFKAA